MSENRIQGGYILLSRKIIESEIWSKPPLYLKIWIYLLSRAQFKKYRGLERGQVFFSIPEIQEACSHYVGFRKEVPTYKQVRKAVEWMKQASNTDNRRFPYEGQMKGNTKGNMKGNTKGNMIEVKKTTRGVVADIVNYNVYQDPNSYENNTLNLHEGQHEGRMKGNMKDERRASSGHTIDKNDKKDKNERMIDTNRFVNTWNENFNSKINEKQFNQSINQLSNYSDEEIFNVLDKATKSDYLLGLTENNKRGLTLHFFTKPENFEKIRAGNYDTFTSKKEPKDEEMSDFMKEIYAERDQYD